MNNYAGKICPFCKTEFGPDDDVVVCSKCDMPHHKECWIENQECTTFGCTGTIKTADSSDTSVTSSQMKYDDNINDAHPDNVYCSICGALNSSSYSFCIKCGNKLIKSVDFSPRAQVYPNSGLQTVNPYYDHQRGGYNQLNSSVYTGYNAYQPYQSVKIDTDIQKLICVNTEYYIKKFTELKSQNKKTSWNWSAFLVPPFWLIYRKMYVYGIIMLIVMLALSLMGMGIISLFMLAGYIIFGLFANNIYMSFLECKAAQAKVMLEPKRSQYIANNGGINTVVAILAAVVYFLFIIILS